MTLEPCFEYTYRWDQLVGDLLSGDPNRVREAVLRLEERDREIEQKVCEASAAPQSACGEVYSGAVDSYTEAPVTDVAGWDSTYVIGLATILVHNNTGVAGLVELTGQFTANGTPLGTGDLLSMTLADGEKIKLTDVCTIQRDGTSNGYLVANIGATNVSVTVNATFTETEAGAACCTGGG